MPIYEYQCQACGKVTDIRHGFDERNSQACPACEGTLVRRFSPAGIVFKGSGFYVTDSRKSGDTGKSAGSSGSSSDGKAADGKAADGKSSDDKPSDSKAESAKSSSTGPSEGSGGSGGAAKGETAAA
jgi:putative FmdB family regulatory protein